MENPVEEIKKRLDIIEFIGSFITLKKAGRNFKAVCPFHQEKTPSFIVSPERQIWHCFGACGEGGDVIRFLMKWENITFIEALRELAKKTGVVLRKVSFEDRLWKKRERFFNMNFLATEFFQYVLNKTRFGKKGLDYLNSREVNSSIAKKFQLGYAPDSWDSLKTFLKRKKFAEEEILENGLIIKGESGRYYDRFRGRLIFPLKDTRNNVIAFSGRTLDENAKEAKYINSPETAIYHKRETLFGINLARESIKKENNVYLVEGEFDIITPYSHGFNNFVAIKGSALTSEQLMLLKRYTDRITLFLDADTAGEEAVKRGIDEAERFDFDIRVVSLDFAKDPDEAIKKDLKSFKKVLEKPVAIYDYLINLAKKRYPSDSAFDKKKIGDEIIPYLEKISNPIVRSHYVKKLAKLLLVTEGSIENLITKLKRKKKILASYKPIVSHQPKEARELVIEKYLLSCLFQEEDNKQLFKKIFSVLTAGDFYLPADQKIIRQYVEFKNLKKDSLKINNFINQLAAELKPIFDEVYLYASIEEKLNEESLEKVIYEIKTFSLKRQMKKILLEEEENPDKNKQLISLNQALKEVEKKLVSL